MEIVDKRLQHLQEHFASIGGTVLRPAPELYKGMYWIKHDQPACTIFYDEQLVYLREEIQYFIIFHALFMKDLLQPGSHPQLQEVYAQADPAAVKRAHKKFPAFSLDYFVGALYQYLLKSSVTFDNERLQRLGKVIPHRYEANNRKIVYENFVRKQKTQA